MIGHSMNRNYLIDYFNATLVPTGIYGEDGTLGHIGFYDPYAQGFVSSFATAEEIETALPKLLEMSDVMIDIPNSPALLSCFNRLLENGFRPHQLNAIMEYAADATNGIDYNKESLEFLEAPQDGLQEYYELNRDSFEGGINDPDSKESLKRYFDYPHCYKPFIIKQDGKSIALNGLAISSDTAVVGPVGTLKPYCKKGVASFGMQRTVEVFVKNYAEERTLLLSTGYDANKADYIEWYRKFGFREKGLYMILKKKS